MRSETEICVRLMEIAAAMDENSRLYASTDDAAQRAWIRGGNLELSREATILKWVLDTGDHGNEKIKNPSDAAGCRATGK